MLLFLFKWTLQRALPIERVLPCISTGFACLDSMGSV